VQPISLLLRSLFCRDLAYLVALGHSSDCSVQMLLHGFGRFGIIL